MADGGNRLLLKRGERGLIKSYKLRWFVYDDTTGYLKYYKQRGDTKSQG